MEQKEFDELVKQVGEQAAKEIKTQMEGFEKKAKELATSAVKDGGVTKEDFDEYQKKAEEAVDAIKEIAKKQGISIADLTEKMSSGSTGTKSIGQVLEESKEELGKLYSQGSGTKTFMVNVNSKGEFVAQPFDTTKAAGPHATTDGVGGGGNTASISQAIDAATLLRLGGNSPIISQYRNTPWVFDLCNLQNAAYQSNTPFAMWYEEQPKQGSSATVTEGGTKPLTQYAYQLKTDTYKKEATLIGFTEEFNMDFTRLQSDILGKGRTDVINRINSVVLTDIIAKATAYNTAAEFTGGTPIPFANDFDVLAAMAAQVDNATYGNLANAAVMSTFKKYRMGVEKDQNGMYLNRPGIINNLSMIGNPAMGTDAVLVGDFMKYNIILRGGFIVRVGYNGTDFAENKFSVVLEQFYYNHISSLHQSSIVKGETFAAVKAAIGS